MLRRYAIGATDSICRRVKLNVAVSFVHRLHRLRHLHGRSLNKSTTVYTRHEGRLPFSTFDHREILQAVRTADTRRRHFACCTSRRRRASSSARSLKAQVEAPAPFEIITIQGARRLLKKSVLDFSTSLAPLLRKDTRRGFCGAREIKCLTHMPSSIELGPGHPWPGTSRALERVFQRPASPAAGFGGQDPGLPGDLSPRRDR